MKEIRIDSIRVEKKSLPKTSSENSFSFNDLLTKNISFNKQVLNDKTKERFYHEFNTLLSAGIDFKTALEIIENDFTSKRIKTVFKELQKSVIGGKGLSDCMKESKQFTPFEYSSIAIGEETGRLQEQLNELSTYFSQKVKQKRQIIGALTYPAIVLLVAAGAIIFMLNYLVPMFEDIFKRFGGNLPRLTQFIIQCSDFVGNYLVFILISLFGIGILNYTQRNKLYYQKLSSFILLKTPFVGKLMLKVYLAQFTNSMQLLINSSIPLVKALDLTEKMTQFYPIKKTIDPLKSDIVKGVPLNVAMKKFPVYPSRMVSILRVAEETNTLGLSFQRMTKQYQEEVQHQTSLINTALEPVIIVVLGLVISVILIAMYLPLFQVNSLMNV